MLANKYLSIISEVGFLSQTSLSYICSTNLTNFLELFLHLPGIDVNKADNEGNTPLHFAAQAGNLKIDVMFDAVRLLRSWIRYRTGSIQLMWELHVAPFTISHNFGKTNFHRCAMNVKRALQIVIDIFYKYAKWMDNPRLLIHYQHGKCITDIDLTFLILMSLIWMVTLNSRNAHDLKLTWMLMLWMCPAYRNDMP